MAIQVIGCNKKPVATPDAERKRYNNKFGKKANTYSCGNSLVVTHPTTNPPLSSLSVSAYVFVFLREAVKTFLWS